MSGGYCRLNNKFYPSVDNHHVVPTAYGGSPNGRQVQLGPDTHQTLHRCVNNPELKDQFISSLPQSSRKLASQLIEIIRISKQKFEDKGSPTKRMVLEVPTQQYEKLKVVASNLQVSPNQLLIRYINNL